MSLFNWLIKKNRRVQDDQEIVGSGICPNCWGSQSYDGQFIEAIKDRQIDINNGDVTNAFIQDFVKTHLEPIKFQNHDIYSQCPACKMKYTR